MTHTEWLEALQQSGADAARLWPRTAFGNMQAEIWRRVGASDMNFADGRCRARSIVTQLQDMQVNRLLGDEPHILDVFCGDAVVLWQIKRRLDGAHCYGVDLQEYGWHWRARADGVRLFRVAAQELVRSTPPEPFDVVLLLNTFRGWERADLPESDRDLPARMLAWLRAHARYSIVTATEAQQRDLRDVGWFCIDIGCGEDDSRMYLMFPCGEQWSPGQQQRS